MVCMKRLVIKVGANVDKDLRAAMKNPNTFEPGAHTIYVKDADGVRKLLSPERINLLKQSLAYSPRACVSDFVKKTGRKQEAISRDASVLEKYGVIKKVKKGRNVYLEPQIKSIEIVFG